MMCEKCLYRKNCQFLAKRKSCKVEGCTAFKSEKELIADTVRKMQEMVYEFADDINTIDAYIIKEMIDQIAKELLEGE